MDVEQKAIEFLNLVFNSIPYEQVNKWGAARYKRFRTIVWKYIQTTTDLNNFVSKFCQYYSAENLLDITVFIDSCQEKNKLFEYIRENLAIIVGRMQFKIKQDKKSKGV